jgi:hypothetical protein
MGSEVQGSKIQGFTAFEPEILNLSIFIGGTSGE